jgi:hypothetical protein
MHDFRDSAAAAMTPMPGRLPGNDASMLVTRESPVPHRLRRWSANAVRSAAGDDHRSHWRRDAVRLACALSADV